MLPTQEEKDKKYQELRHKYNFNNSMMNIEGLLNEYTKWYAEQVVKHCAEVAKCINKTPERTRIVDKQSILNVINEL